MSVLVTRPVEQALEVVRALEPLGFSVYVEPLLLLEPVDYIGVNWTHFDAVIFTSANGIRFLKHTALDIPCLCVGEGTAKTAIEKGFVDVRVCGHNVENLEQYITTHCSPLMRFLYISGETVHKDLTMALASYLVHRLVVYRSVAKTVFSPGVLERFQHNTIKDVVLFSQKTAQAFVQCVNHGKIDLRLVTLYCLSANVAYPCQNLACWDIVIASEPTQQAIIKLLKGD